MINPIQLSHISSQELERREKKFQEQFEIDILKKPVEEDYDYSEEVLTEAVFNDGKNTIAPIIGSFQIIKSTLEKEIQEKGHRFDPRAFWKNTIFRDLENSLIKVFGFRSVDIYPLVESYNKSTDDFTSKMMNCYTFIPNQRFPIDGLVTDKGFYDNSHSLKSSVIFTLGIVRICTPEELTAILIHEIGHNIDPALVDINYIKANILSKYLTDRENKISSTEKKAMGDQEFGFIHIVVGLIALFIGFTAILSFIFTKLADWFFDPDKAILQLKTIIRNQKNTFTRQTNIEAYADNFARMYGMGAHLISGLRKLSESEDKRLESRVMKEKARQRYITEMTKFSLIDVHMTTIHRIHSLLKEYEADLKDPNIPAAVKKDIKADMEELKLVLDKYLNEKDAFRARINKTIYDELVRKDKSLKPKNPPTDKKGKKDKEVVESVDELYEKSDYVSLTPEEREDAGKKFGSDKLGFITKDKDGKFLARTHRAKSKSYDSLNSLPKEDVEFIASTN